MLRQGATPSETVPSESSSPESVRRGAVRRRSIALFCAALIISILAHLGSAVKLGTYHNNNPLVRPSSQSSKGVKMRIVTSQKSDPQVDKKDNLPLLEVKQQETLPPSEASHLGQVNHQTTKETRVSNTIPRPKGADAGAAGDSVQSRQPRSASVTQKQSASSESLDEVPKTRPKLTVGSSNVKVRSGQQRRQAYEAFLPSSFEELSGQVKVGYQDHLDDQLAEGDSIDINTREYRYIGYFTNMRKAIELVWNYPAAAARRRLEGETVLEFAIARNGSTSGN